MAENLRKLISSESLRLMHDNLERWLREYNVSQGWRPLGARAPSSSLHSRRQGFLRPGIGAAALQSPGGCDFYLGLKPPNGITGKEGRAGVCGSSFLPATRGSARDAQARSAGLGVQQQRAQSLPLAVTKDAGGPNNGKDLGSTGLMVKCASLPFLSAAIYPPVAISS